MNSNKFASFAAYTPPPDQHIPSTSQPSNRPWPSLSQPDVSYQSGGVPVGTTIPEDTESQQSVWETRYGFRVDLEAAFAYILGPLTAFIILVVETQNDFVRFHGYQSALLTGPLLLFRIFMSLLQFPSWMRTLVSLGLLGVQFYMAFRAYVDASQNGLVRYQLPYIGPIAEQYVSEE